MFLLHSTQPLSVPPDLMIDEPQVDGSHSAVKAIEHQSNNPANLKHESPHIDFHILEDAQVASMAAVHGHEGKSVDTGSDTFDILLGALAEESKATDAPGKDEVGKASLTLMTLASNEPSADDVTDVRAVEVVETDTTLGAAKDDKQVDLSDVVSRCIGSSRNRYHMQCQTQTQKEEGSSVKY